MPKFIYDFSSTLSQILKINQSWGAVGQAWEVPSSNFGGDFIFSRKISMSFYLFSYLHLRINFDQHSMNNTQGESF